MLEGGRPCTDCGVLVEGTALYFGGADARQAVTADLDLRGAKSVLIVAPFLHFYNFFLSLNIVLLEKKNCMLCG